MPREAEDRRARGQPEELAILNYRPPQAQPSIPWQTIRGVGHGRRDHLPVWGHCRGEKPVQKGLHAGRITGRLGNILYFSHVGYVSGLAELSRAIKSKCAHDPVRPGRVSILPSGSRVSIEPFRLRPSIKLQTRKDRYP